MNRRCRKDLNQPEIVRQLRQLGASVLVVSALGIGFDLLVGHRGENYLIEIKRPGHKSDLTPHEKKLQEHWRGTYLIVETLDDFLRET